MRLGGREGGRSFTVPRPSLLAEKIFEIGVDDGHRFRFPRDQSRVVRKLIIVVVVVIFVVIMVVNVVAAFPDGKVAMRRR